ncbi:hypothetical protein HPB47_013807 [Ixodes persulcatus]|uniref:Uncharacterized protein n=1 Tax=Ixodes persulcatus TaxID=34615 RepID=A0AC60R0B2_IXOPE|nr:hypothetical protein HPB47_013807 [Ixodes persulcatus]
MGATSRCHTAKRPNRKTKLLAESLRNARSRSDPPVHTTAAPPRTSGTLPCRRLIPLLLSSMRRLFLRLVAATATASDAAPDTIYQYVCQTRPATRPNRLRRRPPVLAGYSSDVDEIETDKRVTCNADSSSSDGVLEPTSRRTKRSARKHWDTASQCLSLVPKRQRTDEELELPFAVQECIRRLRRSDVEQRFTITSHNVPDVICQKINRLSASEGASNHSTIIILDGSALAVASNPVGAVEFTEFPPHGGNGPSRGLLGFVGRYLDPSSV